jgi:uncharacterized membrane protein HdeD (DUF308 family)
VLATGDGARDKRSMGGLRTNWHVQLGLAAAVGLLGLVVLFNPTGAVGLAASVIPWLLVGAGLLYLISVLFRRWRLILLTPILIGALLLYLGLSMKFGDPRTAGPIPLLLVLALLLFGAGVAKLVLAADARGGRWFPLLLGSGIASAAVGLVVIFAWETISTRFIGVVLGLQLLADAVMLAALALRERDREAEPAPPPAAAAAADRAGGTSLS